MNIKKTVADIAGWIVVLVALPFTLLEWATMCARQLKVRALVSLARWSGNEGLRTQATRVCAIFKNAHECSIEKYDVLIEELE